MDTAALMKLQATLLAIGYKQFKIQKCKSLKKGGYRPTLSIKIPVLEQSSAYPT